MPQSLTQIYLHIIFSTKNRQPFLNNEQIRKQTHAYLAGICKNLQCPSLLVGGVADHVHLLTRHSKNVAVADFIGNLKRASSKWVKEKIENSPRFIGKKDTELFRSALLMLRVSENTSLPRENTIAMSRFRMNFAGYARNMALSSMSVTFGIEPREDCKTPSGFP